MRSEGDDAPAVTLPAYADGERREVDLDDYLGEGIVVLAFYPADFNPACTMQSSDLDDLDLFTMQKDVTVFGVSPDSTYSHEAFAERYGLHVPLLSDRDGEAAAAYGVAQTTEHSERLVERAVFVVDHRGTVQYAWATDDLDAGFDVAPVKQAVGDIGGDDTALERYRVGHEHYAEGRATFTEAMADYEDREWMDARNGFEAAEPEFTAAADHFDTAVRFAETDDFETVVDRGEEKADTLSHAASWLADSADALASGRGKQGAQYREDAERLVDAATELPDPPKPDAFTLTDAGVALDESVVVDPAEDEGYAWRADDGAGADTALGVDDADLDAAVAGDDGEFDTGGGDAEAGTTVEGDTVEGDLEMDMDAVDEAAEAAAADTEPGAAVEDDTVEGDLEMDLDAVQEAAADSPADEAADAAAVANAGSETGGGPTTAADGPADESEDEEEDETETPLYRGGSAGTPPAGDDAGTAASDDVATDPAESDEVGAAAESGEDDEGGDPDDDVEELELVDPTEGGDEEEDDERSDWDIPGR